MPIIMAGIEVLKDKLLIRYQTTNYLAFDFVEKFGPRCESQ